MHHPVTEHQLSYHSNSSLNSQFELIWPHLKSFNETNLDGEHPISPGSDFNKIGDVSDAMAKVCAMAVLGIGSFATGLMPSLLSKGTRKRFPLLTSLLLCFGAGVLLSTALVHILPEVRNQLANNWAEITFCMGFFSIYFTDEFIHYFFGRGHHHHHHHNNNSTLVQTVNACGHNSAAVRPSVESSSQYGSLNSTDNESLLNQLPATPLSNDVNILNGNLVTRGEQNSGSVDIRVTTEKLYSAGNSGNTRHRQEESTPISRAGTFGLLTALSIHSSIEGLAIGVQDSASKVFFLLGAVSSHKFVMGFCLGLELYSNPHHHFRNHILAILVFSLGAVFGIGTGMLLVDLPDFWNVNALLPIVQGLAGGTLLYVTVCEVIPREKNRTQQGIVLHKLVGFWKLLSIIGGFILMCLLNHYLDDDS